jgi:hypothetical protein
MLFIVGNMFHAPCTKRKQKNLLIMEKINMKYLGTLEHPIAKMLMGNIRKGTEIAIEITPKFFSSWEMERLSSSRSISKQMHLQEKLCCQGQLLTN